MSRYRARKTKREVGGMKRVEKKEKIAGPGFTDEPCAFSGCPLTEMCLFTNAVTYISVCVCVCACILGRIFFACRPHVNMQIRNTQINAKRKFNLVSDLG